jgi:hypothetical protein
MGLRIHCRCRSFLHPLPASKWRLDLQFDFFRRNHLLPFFSLLLSNVKYNINKHLFRKKNMVNGFLKSDEGIQEYSKIGLPYPNSTQDDLYEDWLAETQGYTEENAQYFRPHKEKELHRITRVKLGDGKEYLTCQFMHYRLDAAANLTHRYQSEVGVYTIPRPHYKFSHMDFGQMQRTVDEVTSIERGYSIPFTKENIEKIHDMGLQYEGKVQYALSLPNGLRSSIRTFEDLRDGVFEELAHFGRIPTEAQRQRWLIEGGPALDSQMQEDFIRMRTEGDIPQRPVTAEEVKKMIIKHELQQQQEQQPTEAKEESKSNSKKKK